MTALIDLNVLLDVIQNREPHVVASAEVLSRAVSGEFQACVASHAVPTFYYVVRKGAGDAAGRQAVEWLLKNLVIVGSEQTDFQQALILNMSDFEDAVLSCVAARTGCDYIISRNEADFARSPVRCLSPAAILSLLDSQTTPSA
ncbi:MAG: PIN domain-containing protein [Planctomycetales bacterium]|nr:PIN domain-containing protein [Planctomycetales bacterium]